jgi:hypothetical protein
LLQGFKSVLTFERPVEDGVLLRQIDQRGNYLRVVLNKTVVEVAEAVKSEDVGRRSRSLPLEDSPDFLGVHLKPVSADDQAKELSLSNEELALR